MHTIRKDKEKDEKEGKDLAFSIGELIAYEDKNGNQNRAEKLRNIQALPITTQADILADFLAVTEIANHLDLTYGEDGRYISGFEKELKLAKESQMTPRRTPTQQQ